MAQIRRMPDRFAASASEVGLLRNLERIIHLDTQIPYGAFQLPMSEQQLAGSQVSSLLVDQLTLVRRRL